MTVTDIRVRTSFREHRKRKRLNLTLGLEPSGTDYLLNLWLATAENHPSGVLRGMDKIDIALEAGWEGDSDKFVDGLETAGFLERLEDGTYFLHDWTEHQRWVIHAEERSEHARKAAEARWKKQTGSDTAADEMPGACPEHAEGNAPSKKSDAPSPIPSPSPSPNPKPKEETPCRPDGRPPAKEIIDYLNEKTGKSFRANTKTTLNLIKARWEGDGFKLEDFKKVIDNRVAKWGSDPSMAQYLRPQTLFGTKFESYLNDNGGNPHGEFGNKQYVGTPSSEIPWIN